MVLLSMPTSTTSGRGSWSPRNESRASTVASSSRSSAPAARSTTGTPTATAATTASRTSRTLRWRARTVQAPPLAVRQDGEVVADRERAVVLQRRGREGFLVRPVPLQVAARLARHVDPDLARLVAAHEEIGAAVGDVVAVHEDHAVA